MESNVLAVSKYYKTQNLAHAVKTGDEQAIQKAGELMSKLVHQQGCIFVPVPSHTGKATYTLEIAKIIARNTHGYVSNILGGKKRETLYQQKLKGINASSVDLGMSISNLDYPPEMIANRDIYLVDNVVSTGETYKQAIQALINLTGVSPKILVLGYVDDETIQKKNYKPIQHSLSMNPSFMESKKQAILKRLLNESEWNFHHGNNHDMTPYGSENKYICYHETGQFGSGTYFSTFNTKYEKNNDMEKYVDNSSNNNPNFIKVGDGVYRVDFDLYKNLYRVYSEKQGDILHTMCSYLNAFYHAVSGWGLGHYHPKQADFNNSRFYQIIRYNSDSLGLKCPSYLQLTRMAQKHAQSEEKQSFSTVFMEWNGFNGVNVSGVGKFDTTRHGSVIYDLSKTSLEPVEIGKTGWFHNVGGYHTNTIATKSWDWKDNTMIDSLRGRFNSLGWDEMDDKSKLRVLKNIFSDGNVNLSSEDVSRLLYRLRNNQQLQNYVYKQLFDPQKVDSDITLDSDVKDEIVKAKQYYFVNYTTPENYRGWRSNDFFEEFLSNHKWSNWDATNEDLQSFLTMLMGYLKRPLTQEEEKYIKEYYFE